MRLLLLLAALCAAPMTWAAPAETCPATLDVQARPLTARAAESLCARYAGQVLLVVNTASQCGFTPQYDGLEALYQRYRFISGWRRRRAVIRNGTSINTCWIARVRWWRASRHRRVRMIRP